MAQSQPIWTALAQFMAYINKLAVILLKWLIDK